jgi:two-component system response regulator RstA
MNKIVYVEDEPEVGQLIAAYLGKHDMDVIVEPRGDRAEEVVVRKPGSGAAGYHVARQRRHDALRPARPVGGPYRLLTSLDSDMNHILSLEMGANDTF